MAGRAPGRNDQGRESRCTGERLEREQRGLRVLRMAQVQWPVTRYRHELMQAGFAVAAPVLTAAKVQNQKTMIPVL
ncbi:hypothetical protein D9M71_718890 [compost metagenome]